jgi:hypothetical protein
VSKNSAGLLDVLDADQDGFITQADLQRQAYAMRKLCLACFHEFCVQILSRCIRMSFHAYGNKAHGEGRVEHGRPRFAREGEVGKRALCSIYEVS